ncbi:MAG: threonylcarbamoyl-AMP synthase [Planctomycetaceae bacterium]|nr:threonylcarbamoyl-AMP synthase [Planctomycetaceae bacterium]
MACEIGTDLERAADIIRRGGLVGMPTETVYGLAANALDSQAVARIFEAKERPAFDPLIVHVPDVSWMPRVAAEFPELGQRLAARFWPGPLTILLPKTAAVPDLVTSGLPDVGVRIPYHPMALTLMRMSELPVAAPSANLFGRISPTTAQHVADQLAGRVDYILDGGPCGVGVESTVVRLSPRPGLLRPGGVSLEDLMQITGAMEIVDSTDHPGEVAQSAPGMLPQHYAPRTQLILDPPAEQVLMGRWGVLCFQRPPEGNEFSAQEILSPQGNLTDAAANFFAALRRLDELGLDGIVAESFPEAGLGRALNDRLRRAAAPK